jgi:CDP-4-dehydro-6-deoxyglucose reductase, E3
MRVSLPKTHRSFSVEPGRSMLDAALAAGLNLPHSCKSGNCGACRARLLAGDLHYPNGPPLGLSAAEVEDGLILLCQARARSDLSIEIFEVTTPEEAVIRRLPSRIERTESWSHDVMGLYLRLPAVETFGFEPGQYVDIMLPGGRRRSFSIASPPHDSRFLELHVRRVPGGELTERFFAADPRNSLLTIEGPLGRFVYRQNSSPLLLVGGGTGLAPLKSILRHVIETGLKRDMFLYWGVRSERDLYAHAQLTELARRVPSFHYEAVLSEPGADWAGRSGWVHEAVLRDFDVLDRYDIYASGPPLMVSAVRLHFPRHGADPQRLFSDSFDYAPDTLERQRSMVASRS